MPHPTTTIIAGLSVWSEAECTTRQLARVAVRMIDTLHKVDGLYRRDSAVSAKATLAVAGTHIFTATSTDSGGFPDMKGTSYAKRTNSEGARERGSEGGCVCVCGRKMVGNAMWCLFTRGQARERREREREIEEMEEGGGSERD